jgi:heat-inducible transcriptional repressor
MILDDRKKNIIQAIVEDYISTGEPVGSRTVAKKYNLGFSPATIRNDMSDLEEMGLIEQLHTSSGRIPSDLGYRTYVDRIMKSQNLSTEETRCINQKLENIMQEMSQFIKQVSVILSEITHYTAVATTPQLFKSIIKRLQLIPIDKSKVLLVIITHSGIVKNFVVGVNKQYSAEFLFEVSNILNERFAGVQASSVDSILDEMFQKEFANEREFLYPIFKTLERNMFSAEATDVYLEGTSNIFKFPEFNNLLKARELIEILDEKEFLVKLVTTPNDDNVQILIGAENEFKEIEGCSLVKTSYWVGDKLIGSVGVIGPTRMNYSKVVSCIEYIRKQMEKILNGV